MPAFYPFRFVWFGALALGLAVRAAAQTPSADTTRLKYGEELALAPPAAPAAVQREQRSCWKLGLNNFLLYAYPFSSSHNYTYYTRYGLHLAYERRLGRAWSAQAEVSPALAHYRLAGDPGIGTGLSVRAQLAGRYYYNLERRLRRGRYIGNFAANYVSLALGTGGGGPVRETPFYLVAGGPGPLADAALLYGVQRPLGRHGFVDANVGASALLAGGAVQRLGFNASLRVGLALPAATYAAPPVPPDDAQALQPRAYVGAQAGAYFYRVHYADAFPYPAETTKLLPNETQWVFYPRGVGHGYGAYTDNLIAWPLPYLYAGYYLTPRLAVQLGAQWSRARDPLSGTFVSTPARQFGVQNMFFESRHLALPAQVRYALTPSFLARWQVDAIGGVTPVWSSARFEEYRIVDHQATAEQTFGFQRRDVGWHATLGLSTSYSFGRRRQVQATVESLSVKDLRTGFRNDEPILSGVSVGLRYRFGYR